MAKLAMHRPFDERHLDYDLRSHPMRAHAWKTLGLGERRLRDLDGVQSRAQLEQQLCIEARADLSSEDELALLEVADQQRPQSHSGALGICKAAHDELLRCLALHLEPMRRA